MILHVLTIGLLAAGVLVELLCGLGVLMMRTPLDRLHFVAPATTLGPALIAAAVIAGKSGLQSDLKAVLIALILLLTSPVVTYATAHAVREEESELGKEAQS
jgi:multicomponent Na+:H+ antiporter subunit G